MYWSASSETSAPCRFSRMSTSGFPPARRDERPRDELVDLDPVLGLLLGARRDDARIGADGRAQLGDLGQLGKERKKVGREVGEVGTLGRRATRFLVAEVVLHELAEALVGEGAVELDEPPVERADLAHRRELLQLLEETRLSDPRLARHGDELAVAGDRGIQAVLQLGELLLPPDERRRCGPREHAARRVDQRHRILVARETRPAPAERLDELDRPLRPPGRVLLEALHHDRLQPLANVRAERAGRLRDLVHDPVENGLRLARERRLARQALVENGPERVDVGPSVERVGRDLLRGQVGDRADERPRLRQAVVGGRVGEPEVHHADPDVSALLAGDHDVLGLDVAVNDAAGVAVLERLGGLDRDVEHFSQAQRAVPEHVSQARAHDERHHEEVGPFVATDVVDRNDAGVIHLRDDLRLALEPLLGVRRQLAGSDELDRDVAVQARVARPVDDTHPAAADFRHDLVAIGELRVDHRARGARRSRLNPYFS